MATIDYAALRDEIVNDPTGVGYKVAGDVWSGGESKPKPFQDIAAMLNQPRAGATITRRKVRTVELFAAIPLAEYEKYTEAQRDYVSAMLSLAGGEDSYIDASDPVVWANLQRLFADDSKARENLVAKVRRDGSRAEVLFGEGALVTDADVVRALNLIEKAAKR